MPSASRTTWTRSESALGLKYACTSVELRARDQKSSTDASMRTTTRRLSIVSEEIHEMRFGRLLVMERVRGASRVRGRATVSGELGFTGGGDHDGMILENSAYVFAK